MAERNVEITHVFDAPREAVFEAWIDPDQVARWWSPDGLDVPRESVRIEPRVGGRYDLTMVELEGDARYPVRAEVVEISPPELIVLQQEAMPEAGLPEATVTRVVFEADGDRTRMTVTSGPYPDEMRPNAEAGWTAAVANLDELLRA
jgi:uncharacterized protein YndB with AHSA1/START domain